MNTKIIFFDIDGTILSHRTHTISESTKSAIREAKSNGHLVFVNTGRTYVGLDERIRSIGFDGYVCGCGTYINYHDSVLLHTIIPTDICKMLIDDLRDYQIEALLEGANAIYYNDKMESPKLLPPKDAMEHALNKKFLGWDLPDVSFDKFCIWCDVAETYEKFFNKYKDRFDFIDRGDGMYEIIPQGYSKASGIEYLISHLNIPHENTFAFGDGANDLAMLKYVKHSIGMGNSDGGVPDIVSFLTKDVDQDGVDYALRHYNLI